MVEDEGGGLAAGVGGGDGFPAEKNREVPAAVGGVMGALKASAAHFREIQAREHQRSFIHPEEATVCLRNEDVARQMAEMCERAIADLEAMTAPPEDPAVKRPAPASPSAIFRMGFDYGALGMMYEKMSEPERAEKWGDLAPPANNWQDAWAVARAVLASGGPR